MKKLIKNSIYFLLLCLTTIIISCQPGDENNSDTISRADLVGRWNCSESSIQYGNSSFYVDIVIDPTSSNGILMANFHHNGDDDTVRATVSGYLINIPSQQTCGNNETLIGKGDITNANKIDFTYYNNDGADIDTCTATFAR